MTIRSPIVRLRTMLQEALGQKYPAYGQIHISVQDAKVVSVRVEQVLVPRDINGEEQLIIDRKHSVDKHDPQVDHTDRTQVGKTEAAEVRQ